MTYEEAIKYARDTCFCAGCDVDRAQELGKVACDDCGHRQFFELAIYALEVVSNRCNGCKNRDKWWKDEPCNKCQRMSLDHYEKG